MFCASQALSAPMSKACGAETGRVPTKWSKLSFMAGASSVAHCNDTQQRVTITYYQAARLDTDGCLAFHGLELLVHPLARCPQQLCKIFLRQLQTDADLAVAGPVRDTKTVRQLHQLLGQPCPQRQRAQVFHQVEQRADAFGMQAQHGLVELDMPGQNLVEVLLGHAHDGGVATRIGVMRAPFAVEEPHIPEPPSTRPDPRAQAIHSRGGFPRVAIPLPFLKRLTYAQRRISWRSEGERDENHRPALIAARSSRVRIGLSMAYLLHD